MLKFKKSKEDALSLNSSAGEQKTPKLQTRFDSLKPPVKITPQKGDQASSSSSSESSHNESFEKPDEQLREITKKKLNKARLEMSKRCSKKEKNTLTADDFYAKQQEFRVWLREEMKKNSADITESKAKAYFKKFVEKWNKKKLPTKYYRGIDLYLAMTPAVVPVCVSSYVPFKTSKDKHGLWMSIEEPKAVNEGECQSLDALTTSALVDLLPGQKFATVSRTPTLRPRPYSVLCNQSMELGKELFPHVPDSSDNSHPGAFAFSVASSENSLVTKSVDTGFTSFSCFDPSRNYPSKKITHKKTGSSSDQSEICGLQLCGDSASLVSLISPSPYNTSLSEDAISYDNMKSRTTGVESVSFTPKELIASSPRQDLSPLVCADPSHSTSELSGDVCPATSNMTDTESSDVVCSSMLVLPSEGKRLYEQAGDCTVSSGKSDERPLKRQTIWVASVELTPSVSV